MRLEDIPRLNHELIVIEKPDWCEHPLIDFESSKTGLWVEIKSKEEFNESLKSIIKLALFTGHEWSEQESESDLVWKFAAIDGVNDENDLDNLFSEAFNFLSEGAYESDPGWEFVFNWNGLEMRSMWLGDDPWADDREERPPTPQLSSDAIRKSFSLF